MAMGKTDRSGSQEPLWVAGADLPRSAGHPFYERLNGILEAGGFDELVESECAQFYAERMGRPSLSPGRYFRLLLVGYFEGLDSERGIAWRAQDSLSIRRFLGVGRDRVGAGSFDHFAYASAGRRGDSQQSVLVGAWSSGGVGSGVGQDGGHGRDDAGGERGVAEHRAS